MPAPRSPSYPNISLSDAIAKASQIYQKENMSTMTPEVAAEAMGYTGINGASLKTIAALKKWGLLEGRAEDLRLTTDAQTLSIDEPGSQDYREALARSAAAPEVFGEISKQFPSGASERNIAVFLQKNGFQPDAASTVAKHFKETLALVSGGGAHYTGGEDQQEQSVKLSQHADPARPRPPIRYPTDYPASPPSGGGGYESRSVGDANAPYRITMNGTKLHIEADVDLAGLLTLKQMLEGYEKILTLLATPSGQAVRPPWAGKSFSQGDEVPATGLYSVYHLSHLSASPSDNQVALKAGDKFPTCENCDMQGTRYEFLG
jgi:hypothetical protein